MDIVTRYIKTTDKTRPTPVRCWRLTGGDTPSSHICKLTLPTTLAAKNAYTLYIELNTYQDVGGYVTQLELKGVRPIKYVPFATENEKIREQVFFEQLGGVDVLLNHHCSDLSTEQIQQVKNRVAHILTVDSFFRFS